VKLSRYDTDKDGRCDAAACRNLVFLLPNETPCTEVEPIVQQGLAKLGIVLKPRELATGAVFTTFQTVANKIPPVQQLLDHPPSATPTTPWSGSRPTRRPS
jgi:hypothetical protein